MRIKTKVMFTKSVFYKQAYLLFIFCLIFGNRQVCAQETSSEADIKVVRKVAGRILDSTTYDFITKDKGKIIKAIKSDETTSADNILIRSPYNRWSYWNGVLNIAMLRIAPTLSDDTYKSFAVKNYDFVFDNVVFFKKRYTGKRRWDYPFATLFTTKELDDCGAIGAGLIEVNSISPRKDFQIYIDSAASFILNKQVRLADSTLVREWPRKMTLWADDLYMSVVFLARMGNATGKNIYFDDAIKQVNNFNGYLFNTRNNLFYHGWYSDENMNGVAHWGRCNGWVMMAMVELLNYLPHSYPGRDNIIQILKQHILGISRYQDVSGMWHQLIDKNDSYLETSSTAMFTYCIARAVNMGWIKKSYMSIALEGWKGVNTNITSDGQVTNICMGTGIEEDLIYYYKRPAPINDIHGLGAVLLAGDEIIRYKRNNGK